MRGLNEKADRDAIADGTWYLDASGGQGLDHRPVRSTGENECGTD